MKNSERAQRDKDQTRMEKSNEKHRKNKQRPLSVDNTSLLKAAIQKNQENIISISPDFQSKNDNNSQYSQSMKKNTNHETKANGKCLSVEKDSSLYDPKFEQIFERFKNFEATKINKIQELKLKIQRDEEKNLQKVPQINVKSKQLVQTNDNFLTRLHKYMATSEKKKKKLIENEQKKKEEQDKKLIEELRTQNKTNHIKKIESKFIQDKVQSMYEWEARRLKKINQMKQIDTKKLKEVCTFKPEIDKNSNLIAMKKEFLECGSTALTFERLYRQDIMKRKKRKEMLDEEFAPSFTPVINQYKNTSAHTEGNATGIQVKQNDMNVESMANKENITEEILKERVRMLRKQKFEPGTEDEDF